MNMKPLIEKYISNTFADLLNEFKNGKIVFDCDDGYPYVFRLKMNYNIHINGKVFKSVKDDQSPCIIINDYSKFMELLKESVKVRWDFHQGELENLQKIAYPKYLMALTFVNMTEDDFKNPNQYLEDLIKSYNKILVSRDNLKKIELDDTYKLSLLVKKEKLGLESPYSYTYVLSNKDKHYYFPSISAIKVDDRLIIRSLQNKDYVSDEDFKEKIENYLKENMPREGLNKKEVSYLRNVNPSFVIALNMFIEQTKEKYEEIKTVEFPLYSPMRYLNKRDTMLNKINKYQDDKKNYESKLEETELQLDNIQNHISNIFLYTALRMQYHIPNYEILDYGETGSFLKFKINDKQEEKDKIFEKFSVSLMSRTK